MLVDSALYMLENSVFYAELDALLYTEYNCRNAFLVDAIGLEINACRMCATFAADVLRGPLICLSKVFPSAKNFQCQSKILFSDGGVFFILSTEHSLNSNGGYGSKVPTYAISFFAGSHHLCFTASKVI